MYVTVVKNRNSPPAILLRESYRENGKVKNRTLQNLSHWPPAQVDALRAVLAGDYSRVGGDDLEIVRSLPHGHVAAVVGLIRKLGLDRILGGARRSRTRDLLCALVAARVLAPASKLATARAFAKDTAIDSLSAVLGVEDADADEVYEAMDALLRKQVRIETELASSRHLDGDLVLYDVTSVWMEGRTCPLARRGYSRDGRPGSLQIVVGVLTDREGCPFAVEVFPGNTGDPSTVTAQLRKLRDRFHVRRVIVVGDRGMLTAARIRDELKKEPDLSWVTSLRGPTVAKLVRKGSVQLGLFDQRDLAEVTDPSFPGERLVVCRNPFRARDAVRRREERLAALEAGLASLNGRLGRDGKATTELEVAEQLGALTRRDFARKFLDIQVSATGVTWQRNAARLADAAAMDGVYVLRTNVPASHLATDDVVLSYKKLAGVGLLFRTMKSTGFEIRPVRHRLTERVRAHVLLCLVAAYVRWHLDEALAPLLYTDEDREGAEALRASPVERAPRSVAAVAKTRAKTTADGLPVLSFTGLMAHLATLTHNTVRTREGAPTFTLYPARTPVQARAFELLGVGHDL
jgi:hypothetical protein